MTTHANQLDIPLDGALRYPIKLIDEFPWRTDLQRDRRPAGHGQHAPDLEGAGRRRGRDRAVELPARGHAEQARAGSGHRQHGGPQAGAGHAVERHPPGPPRRRADRLPAGRGQRRDVLRPPGRRGADAVAEGRPDLVHRLDGGGQAHHGEGRRDAQAGRSSSLAASRRRSCSTTPTSRPRCPRASRSASTAGRAARSRPACCSPAPATRRAWRSCMATLSSVAYGDPAAARRPHGPLISAKQRDRVLGYIEKGVERGPPWPSAAAGRPTSRRAGSSSRPSSPTSTTP